MPKTTKEEIEEIFESETIESLYRFIDYHKENSLGRILLTPRYVVASNILLIAKQLKENGRKFSTIYLTPSEFNFGDWVIKISWGISGFSLEYIKTSGNTINKHEFPTTKISWEHQFMISYKN